MLPNLCYRVKVNNFNLIFYFLFNLILFFLIFKFILFNLDLVYVIVLERICDISKRVGKEVKEWILYQDDDRKWNVKAMVLFFYYNPRRLYWKLE